MSITLDNQQHREWLSQLNFYQDEIKIFQLELLRVVQSHPDDFPVIEHVEEYRAILLKKLHHIDDLRHRLLYHHWKLTQPVDPAIEHDDLKLDITQFVKDFEALKTNFRRFASRKD
ncbi:MAG: hypothetical protein ACK4TA_20180 [Saprospiraceae bacterium]